MRFWVLVALAGCYKPTFTEGLPCSEEGKCPEGQRCDMGTRLCNPMNVPADGTGDGPADTTIVDVPTGSELLVALAFEGLEGGVITDHSGQGNHAGLPTGAVHFENVVPNHGNGAIWRPGDNGILVIDSAPELDIGGTTGAVTVSLWIDSDMDGSQIGVVVERPVDNDGPPFDLPLVQYSLEVSSDVFRAIIGGADGTAPLVCSFSAGANLHHFAYTYDSTSGFTGYLDGAIAQTVSGGCEGGPVPMASRADASIRLGRAGDGGEGFEGKIDNLRIYNRVLTHDEVIATMTATIP